MRAAKQVSYTNHLVSSGLDIRFKELPDVDFHDEHNQQMKIETRISKYIEKDAPHVGDILHSLLNSSSPISAFITDFFCTPTLDFSAKLGIPIVTRNVTGDLRFTLRRPKRVSRHETAVSRDNFSC